VGIMGRIVRNAFLRGSADERRALRQMLQRARFSSHPQRWQIAINSYLTVLNTRSMLLAHAPGIAQTKYPAGGGAPPPPPRTGRFTSLPIAPA
jgi:hypothetical protein